MIQSKNLLVTGGAGFIGSQLCQKLCEGNNKVIIIDNFSEVKEWKYSRDIKENNIKELCSKNNIEIIEGDITNIIDLETVFSKNIIDCVFHMAARAGVRPSVENPQLYEKVNIGGTLNILECMKKYKVKKMIFASSSSVYGNNRKAPFSESDQVDCPISPYAATKKAGELICYTYHHLYNINTICLRFFTVYGPKQRPDLAIHKFVELIDKQKPIPLYGDGNSARDYTYIDDIIGGILGSYNYLNTHDNIYEIINLGNTKTITLNTMVKTIEESMNKKGQKKYESTQPGDVNLTYASIDKAKTKLNYQPKTSFKEGVEKFITWYRKNAK